MIASEKSHPNLSDYGQFLFKKRSLESSEEDFERGSVEFESETMKSK